MKKFVVENIDKNRSSRRLRRKFEMPSGKEAVKNYQSQLNRPRLEKKDLNYYLKERAQVIREIITTKNSTMDSDQAKFLTENEDKIKLLTNSGVEVDGKVILDAIDEGTYSYDLTKFFLDLGIDLPEKSTILARNAVRGNFNLIKLLVKYGADVNGVDKHAVPIINYHRDLKTIKFLMAAGAKEYHLEFYSKVDVATLKFLIKAGTDINKPVRQNPLGESTFTAPPIFHVNNPKLIKLLVESGANVNKPTFSKPYTYYREKFKSYAIFFHTNPVIIKILIKGGADVNKLESERNIKVSTIAHHEDPEIIKLLIKAGADLIKISGINLCLHNSNTEKSKILIDAGFPLNIKNNKKRTEIFYLLTKFIAPIRTDKQIWDAPCLYRFGNWSFDGVIEAMGGAMTDTEAEVFRHRKVMGTIGATPKHTTNGSQDDKKAHNSYMKRTGLEFDEANKIKSLLASYVARGGDIDAQDEHGKTVLWYAFDEFRFDVAEILIASGADLNFRDKNGKTLLHHFGSNLASIGLLVKNGMKLNVKDKSGHSELFYMLTKGKDFSQESIADKNEFKNQQRWLLAKANEYPGMPRQLTDWESLPCKSPLMETLDYDGSYIMYVSPHQAIFDSQNANCEGIAHLANNAVPAVYSYSINCEGLGLPWVETEDRMWNA